jgi:aminopeptidase YwaD
MSPWSRWPIVAFLRSCHPPGCNLSLIIAVVITGSVIAPAFAVDDVSVPNVDRWAEHPALQPFHVSDKELPPNLFLVSTYGHLPATDGITVHGTHDGVYLVSGSTFALRSLSLRGCTVAPVLDIAETPTSVAREWTWIDTPDPAIEAMVDQVRWDGVRDKIQWLVDFGTRYSFAPNHHYVATSIASVFETYGLQTKMHSFLYYGKTMWNIEATQTGTTYPDSYVIICGHFDSMSKNPFRSAPGADDNGTGVATVLTAAEILSRHDFEYSIRYICFDAEELMLIGSHRYAYLARRLGLDIVGVLNFDMMGYWKPGVEKDLEIETNHASQWLANAVINAAGLYTDTPYELHIYDDAWWGDHWYFWKAGYAAVNHEESWDWYDPDFNPYYHSTRDRLEHLDPGFTVGNIKIGVAALATLAGYVAPRIVSFDMRPGSCRNPLNPKSCGVVPALVLGSVDFDVQDIDVASLRIEESVSPSASRVVDMGATSNGSSHPCADMSPDGINDLRLEFLTQDIAAVLAGFGKGDIVPLHLTGRLVNGTPIEGEDVVVIVGGDGRAPLALGIEPPITFGLYQNAPNPFNPTTSIRFDVPPASGVVTLRIYDVNGRLVRTLVNGELAAGQKTVAWNGLNDACIPAAAGMYFYRLTGPGFTRTRKMMLLR